MGVVGGSAAASFRVRTPSGNVANLVGNKQYYSKNGVLIQRPSQRISSLGEKREITFKGIAASKRRRY